MTPAKRPTIAIYGAGGHGRVVADAIAAAARYDLVGFIDDRPADQLRSDLPAPMIGDRGALADLLARGVRRVIVAIGDCPTRARVADELADAGFELTTIIHPSAVVASDIPMGPGSFVAAGSVIAPGARVGRNVIVNTHASVDHDCFIGDHTHVCPGVTLGGSVRIGDRCWVAIGATVIEGVTIGDGAFIAAGAVVVDPVPPAAHVRGVPAKAYAPKRG